MSEVRADLISNRLGTGPAPLRGQWASKAWVNFNGTGTVAIRDSENVSSITDNGNGDYTRNLTSAMASADYAEKVTSDGAAPVAFSVDTVTARTVSILRLRTSTTAGTSTDNAVTSCTTHGDLA